MTGGTEDWDKVAARATPVCFDAKFEWRVLQFRHLCRFITSFTGQKDLEETMI